MASDCEQTPLLIALDEATSDIKKLTLALPMFRNPRDLQKIIQEAEKPIRAGGSYIGNEREEDSYYASLNPPGARQETITSGVNVPPSDDEEVCEKCFLPGRLVICDTCAGLWHTYCASLADVPAETEQWSCEACQLIHEYDDMELVSNSDSDPDLLPEEEEEEDKRYLKADVISDAEDHPGGKTPSTETITVGDIVAKHPRSLGLLDGTIQLSDGTHYHIAHYFGEEHKNLIVSPPIETTSGHRTNQPQLELHSQEPIEQPSNMIIKLHDYQPKGIAQMHWAAEKSPFRSLLVADEMGLGKIIQGIAAMDLVRVEDGMSLVLAPKQVCKEWLKAINRSFVDVRAPHQRILVDIY